MKYINMLSGQINFIGNVNIQLILDRQKKIHLTDINPRVSGSIIFSILAGFNPFTLAYSINNNMKILKPKNIKYGKIFIDIGKLTKNKNKLKSKISDYKIIIFDLDNTIFPLYYYDLIVFRALSSYLGKNLKFQKKIF